MGGQRDAALRFLQEARALAKVRHPNVLAIHAVLEQDGAIALAMELIEGRGLDKLVASDGPLSAAEAARMGTEVCRALAAVHAAGIVHRDVNPANVLREKGGRIVLADFGLGVFMDPEEGSAGAGRCRLAALHGPGAGVGRPCRPAHRPLRRGRPPLLSEHGALPGADGKASGKSSGASARGT